MKKVDIANSRDLDETALDVPPHIHLPRPQGYKIKFILNSAEHEIFPAPKY